MLAKPRWPMNVSEGSHLSLIPSHFFRAESVITYKFVSHQNRGHGHELMHSTSNEWPYLCHSVLLVEICYIYTAGDRIGFLICAEEPVVHAGISLGVFPA